MKTTKIFCGAIVVLFLAVPVQLFAQRMYEHSETRFRFPEYLYLPPSGLVFARTEIRQYPDKRLGVSVTYYNEIFRCFATLYLYTLGLAHLSDGPESDAVKMQFSASESNIFEYGKRGDYGDLKRASAPGEIFQPKSLFQSGASIPRFRMSTFEYVSDGDRRVSWLLLTGTRQHYLKIRYTCPATSAFRVEAAKTFLERLITSFFEENRG